MNTQSINAFNQYLNLSENKILVSELQNAQDKKSFIDIYVNAANEFLVKKGLSTITSKEIETVIPKREVLPYEDINDLQMSSSSAHTQSSCTTSTSAGCTC